MTDCIFRCGEFRKIDTVVGKYTVDGEIRKKISFLVLWVILNYSFSRYLRDRTFVPENKTKHVRRSKRETTYVKMCRY